jgi:hypothetical protein
MSRPDAVSSIGTITAVDRATATFRLKEDEATFCSLCCGGSTEVVSDGCAIPLTDLGPGDVVRWEGVRGEDGLLRAEKVVLLQPAWMTISSPEW